MVNLNVSLLARMELSLTNRVLVLSVILIAPPAPDPLPMNVQVAAMIVLFSPLPLNLKGVAYRRVVKPSFTTVPKSHARIVTRVAQAALQLALVIVWHVQTLVHFCKMEHVYCHRSITLLIMGYFFAINRSTLAR